MSDDKSFTYKDVADHTSKKDLQIVVHDKVYDATSFVDEHPYVSLADVDVLAALEESHD